MFPHPILLPHSGKERARALRWTGPLILLLVGSFAFGQSASPVPANAQKGNASLPHLYWHFLLYQNHLDSVAAQREQQGKDGSWLRTYFQRKLDFTDAQFAIVRSTAQRLGSELQAVDAQAKAIVAADHAANPLQPGSPKVWRPVPPQLTELVQQHEALIQSEVSFLKSTLSPDLAARLDAFLHSEVARNVSVQHLHQASNSDEARQRLFQSMQKKEVH